MKQLIKLIAILLACLSSVGCEEFCPIERHRGANGCENEHKSLEIEIPVENQCFRAAVYEHSRIPADSCLISAEKNLLVYSQVAQQAANQGANIIVFPEDGLFMGSKQQIEIVLSDIPNPDNLSAVDNNPCLQPQYYQDSFIMRNLSCIARDNGLYLVANFGTKQYCEPRSTIGDQICPDSGYFKLNTDVIFDSNGNFIKRYRKFNTFIEVFDKAPTLETVYFDTPFGRFGIFTCFDILFRSPALDLVEKFNIDTALFPTWWYDELPLLSAIQFQDAWSLTNNVNLLAANIHKRELGSIGSGIFSGNNSIYSSASATKPRLVIASLPIKHNSKSDCSNDPKSIMIDVKTESPETDYKYKQYTMLSTDSIFTLKKTQDKHTICLGQVCCTIEYKINTLQSKLDDKIALIVRNSARPGYFNWYEQVCAIVTLETPIDKENLEATRFSTEGSISFEKLKIKGSFESKYVYPILSHDVNNLVDRKDRQIQCIQLTKKLTSCKMDYTGQKNKPINVFGLYGRVYENDMMPY